MILMLQEIKMIQNIGLYKNRQRTGANDVGSIKVEKFTSAD